MPTRTKDTFCSFCGTAYPAPLHYPRTCQSCHLTAWSNPMPVCLVLLPVQHGGREGLLVVRRAEQPRVGWLTLPGGFLEDHELWQEGSAREVQEESGVTISPTGLTPFWFTSTTPRPNRVLLFSVSTAISSLPPFHRTSETSERGLIFGPDGLDPLFAFELHVEAVRRYFAQRGVVGPHGYLEA